MRIDDQTKELIAVGASVASNCQPCLKYHATKALEHGANEHEILEAVEVGKLVRKGAAAQMDKLIADNTPKDLAPVAAPAASCGCPA